MSSKLMGVRVLSWSFLQLEGHDVNTDITHV